MKWTVGEAWAACLAHLEQHSHQGQTTPYNVPDTLYAMTLFTLAECSAARAILEIGVGPESVSGTTFVHSLARRGGALVSVDIDPDLPRPIYRELAARLGVSWSVVTGDSLEVEFHGDPGTMDLVYIDGNHDAAHADGDLRRYLPYVRPGGYLVIDDFRQAPGIGEGRVGIDAQVPWFLHLAHNVPDGNGRLVWQRPL
jgi:predicted O-methyltransferase YrrM